MRNQVFVRKSSWFFKDKEPGDVWICGEYASECVVFIYSDENNQLKTYLKPAYTFDTLYNCPLSKCYKLGIKKEKFDEYYNYLNLYSNSPQSIYSVWRKDSSILEKNGQELHLYDYVIAYLNRNSYFDKEIGILISNNKCLFSDGSTKKIKFCKKATDEDIEYYKDKCDKLKQLCMSLLNQGLKQSVNQIYSVGDIYKKGENIYLYLGNCKILSEFSPRYRGEQINTNVKMNLPEEYQIGGDLWLKMKLSDNYHINKIVFNFLGKKEQETKFNAKQLWIMLTPSITGIKTEVKYGYLDIIKYECFKYNPKASLLGSYIGHIDLDDEFFNNNSFYFANPRSGSEMLQNIKCNLKVKICK